VYYLECYNITVLAIMPGSGLKIVLQIVPNMVTVMVSHRHINVLKQVYCKALFQLLVFYFFFPPETELQL